MNAMPHMEEICRRVVAAYRKAYGDDIEAIYLYGSYVRGERLDVQNKLYNLWTDANEIDLEFDVLTSPMAIPEKIFNEYKHEVGYYGNIFKEGIRID